MWILRTALPSPFGRKVKIAAAICGLSDRIEIVNADTLDAADPLRSQNPLGKIPTLILEDGTALFDSRVIVEFLDAQAGGGVIIPTGKERFPVLALQALADGVTDAALLQVYEGRWRAAEIRHAPWVEHQAGKVERGLQALESAPPALKDTPNVGQVAVACALGYLDLRFEGKWRESSPRLVGWLAEFSRRVPAFEATHPH